MKKFKLEYSLDRWECWIEIDEDAVIEVRGGNSMTLKEAMKSMILFWSGGSDRLDANDGDITKTFLQQLAREIYYIIVQHKFNLLGVVEEFQNREGWWPMDGTHGIRITYIDDVYIDHADFKMEELDSGK